MKILMLLKTRLMQKSTWAGLAVIAGAFAQYGVTPAAIPTVVSGVGLISVDA